MAFVNNADFTVTELSMIHGRSTLKTKPVRRVYQPNPSCGRKRYVVFSYTDFR